jgi:hypothetical protein
VIYSKINPIYLIITTWEGLSRWIPEGSKSTATYSKMGCTYKRAIFKVIAPITEPIVKWVAPITVAT